MTYFGGIFFMMALVILFINTQSFDFSALGNLGPDLRTLVLILLAIAAWAKAAQVPFYTWLPDAMEAPTPVSAYLHAAAMVKAGVYLLARVVLSSYKTLSSRDGVAIAVMAVVTMFVGVFLYFFQDDLKRLLAFSTITQLAFILFGVSLGVRGSAVGFRGGVLHLGCHAVAKGLLFLSVGAIAYTTGTKSIKGLSGLARKMPLTAAAFMVGVFALTGVPPFSCFFSKFFIFTAALSLGGMLGTLFAILVILESLVCFGWFFWVGHKVFFGEPRTLSPGNDGLKDPPLAMSASLIVLMVLCLILPWLAMPIINRIM
jgi:hydrogenase-4 component D